MMENARKKCLSFRKTLFSCILHHQHYDDDGECKKKVSFGKKGLKVSCEYCNESTHWIAACSSLCSFCFRCWCWGHTDQCHENFDEKYINPLINSYNKLRSSFHPGAKEHMLPINVMSMNGSRYTGTKQDLVYIANKLDP